MSKCDIHIVFDRDDRTYRTGELIRGEVRVETDREVSCRELRIELAWRTHGVGNVDQDTLESQVETELKWRGGWGATYPFSFRAPEKPLTYHGQLLNVDWEIRAQADLPWAIDAKASEDVIVLAGPDSRDSYLGSPPIFKKSATGATATFMLILFSPLILMLFAMMLALSPLIVPVILFKVLRRRLAERTLGKVKLEVDAPQISEAAMKHPSITYIGRRGKIATPYAVSPGQDFEVRLHFMPRQNVELGRATATLVGKESCKSGHGTNSVTHRERICQEEFVFAERAHYAPRQPVELSTTVTPPNRPAYSFESSNNELEWELTVAIRLEGSPDWVESRRLRMLPAPLDPLPE